MIGGGLTPTDHMNGGPNLLSKRGCMRYCRLHQSDRLSMERQCARMTAIPFRRDSGAPVLMTGGSPSGLTPTD